MGCLAQQRLRVIRFRRLEVLHFGKDHGEIIRRDGIVIAFPVEHHRERLAPIALTTEQPVAKLVLDCSLPELVGFQPVDGFRFGFRDLHAIEEAAVDGWPFAHVCIAFKPFRRLDGADDRQVECLRKIPIALVLARHGHDRPRAVTHEYVVGDPDGDWLLGGGVRGVKAGEHPGFFLCHHHALDIGSILRGLDVACDLRGICFGRRIVDDLLHQFMLRGQHHVRGSEQGVGPGGEDPQGGDVIRLRRIDQGEIDVRTLAPSDPRGLHGPGRVGPVQRVQVFQQTLGKGGDAEHPLFERFLEDGKVADLRATINDLFIGQGRAQLRAPVDDLV